MIKNISGHSQMTSSAMLRVLLKGAWYAGVPLALVSCST